MRTGVSHKGGNGDDQIDGGDGNDALYGGGGVNTLTGGIGADSFVFTALTDVSGGTQVITDFSHAQSDVIDLSGIDANAGVTGNQAFAFLGAGAFTGVARQLHYIVDGITFHIEGDIDGDGLANFRVDLQNLVAPPVAADFHL